MRLAQRSHWVALLVCWAVSAVAEGPAERVEVVKAADFHAHLTLYAALPFLGNASLRHQARSPSDLFSSQFSESGYDRAGINVVVAALWVPSVVGLTSMESLRRQVDALHFFAKQHPRFAIVQSVSDARRVIKAGRIAVFISVEGADMLVEPGDVDRVLGLGVRMVSLTHFVDTPLLDAEDGQFGSVLRPFTDGSVKGLTPQGRQVVKRAMQRGLLIDVTHASPAAIDALIAEHEVTQVPLVASHVGSAMVEPRTLGGAQAMAIAKLGGLVGIGVFRHPMLQPIPEADRFPAFVEGTCDETMAHYRHFAQLLGDFAVLLGSDFGSPIVRGSPGGACPAGIRGNWDLPQLFNGLVTLGTARASIDDSGERLLQLFERMERDAGTVTAPPASH